MSIIKALKPAADILSYFAYKKDRLKLNKLISQGLKVGKNVYIMEQVEFDLGYPYLIEIGDNCRISKNVRILAHDATTFRDLGITRLAPVRILEGTFIGERALILPGVTIGPRALIAAGSVVNKDIGENQAVAGNPARAYGTFSDLLNKYCEMAPASRIFMKEDIESGKVRISDILEEMGKTHTVYVHGVPKQDPYYINSDMDKIRTNAIDAFAALMQKRSGSGGQDKS